MPLNKYVCYTAHMFPTVLKQLSPYRPNSTAHMSKNATLTYHVTAIYVSATNMSIKCLSCHMAKLLDVHQWGKYANKHAKYELVSINDVTRSAVCRCQTMMMMVMPTWISWVGQRPNQPKIQSSLLRTAYVWLKYKYKPIGYSGTPGKVCHWLIRSQPGLHVVIRWGTFCRPCGANEKGACSMIFRSLDVGLYLNKGLTWIALHWVVDHVSSSLQSS